MNNMTPLVYASRKSETWEATKFILKSILCHKELSDIMEGKLNWPGFGPTHKVGWASLVAQMVENLPAMQET